MSLDPETTVEERVLPALTLLAHPKSARVPARAFLHSPTELSRVAPMFHPLDGGAAAELDDPFLSRSPIVLTPHPDRVDVAPGDGKIKLEADGIPITEPVMFDNARLDRGVVLSLSGRIALLLHRVSPMTENTSGHLDLIGHSGAMSKLRGDIATVAGVHVPVLIRGESGTGKELIARAIHANSSRANQHYEALNMASISSNLAGSELFGHVRGAFTGADRDHKGCFARAHGGTLFLDEVGDTPVDIQAQLLRVLETNDIRPVGAANSMQVDVRVISATDTNLEEAIRTGRFREALVQRLAGFQIHVPALRERREDIGVLFYHFVRQELVQLGEAGLLDTQDIKKPWIPASTVARLARYDWSGNVRQLRNIARQLVISGRGQPTMMTGTALDRLLPQEQQAADAPARLSTLPPPAAPAERTRATTGQPTYRDPSEVTEDEMIDVLRANAFKLAPAAKALNLSRTSLYAMVEQSSQVRKAADLSIDEINGALQSADGKLAAAATALEVSTHALKLRMRTLGLSR